MYVRYTCERKNTSLTKNNIYRVLQTIEDYYFLIKDDHGIENIYEPHLFRIEPLLKVKYTGDDTFSFSHNKIYEVIEIESGFDKNDTYRIIDDTEEDYLFHKDSFVIIEDNTDSVLGLEKGE